MKAKFWKYLDLIFESIFFLVITYTLSSMYTSFKLEWYAILFLVSNVFALTRYYDRVIKITGSKIAAIIALFLCLIGFSYVAYSIGYIHGEFTPFTSLW